MGLLRCVTWPFTPKIPPMAAYFTTAPPTTPNPTTPRDAPLCTHHAYLLRLTNTLAEFDSGAQNRDRV